MAVGSKQQTFEGCNKSDGASPTCSTNGVLVTTAIDAHEWRDVAIMDISGVYIYANNNKFIIMRLWDKITEMMVRVNP